MKEKKFISAEQTPIPGYVGEVQAETTSDSISGAPDIDIDSKTKKRPDFSKDPAFEWNPQESLAPVANPALAPSPSLAPWGQTMPQGVGALPERQPVPVQEPLRNPVLQPNPLAPWGNTVPQTTPSLGRSMGGERITGTNAVPAPEPVVEPRKTLGETLSEAKGQYARDFQQTFGTSEKFAQDFTDYGPQAILGGALLATGAGAMGAVYGPAAVAKGASAVKQGAQTLDDLIEGAKAGRAAFGGAY